jgi:peptidoglycan hydrolase-like protein with peptidoglycan-binding domain
MTADDRKALQQRLTAAGYDTGGTDGVLGSKSRAAISAYQQRNGLQVTGEPSLDLLRRL